MRFTEVVCTYCGKVNDKPAREIKRQQKKGRTKFFCNNSCGAQYSNTPQRIATTIKKCQVCGVHFETKTHGKRARLFCSGLCANQVPRILSLKGMESVRRTGLEHKDNLITTQETLKRREAWKYVELEKRLSGYPHEFECKIGDYIFDLTLPVSMVAIEFDGPDHRVEKQRQMDAKKETQALMLGYTVLRIAVKRASIIPASVLTGIVP